MQNKSVYSLDEVKQLPASRVVVIIDGGIYDVTEFVNLHPGGQELLLKFNRRDASNAFHKTRHSIEAIKILPKYCIGILEGCEAQFQKNIEQSHENISFSKNLQKKLITQEDKFHIHKILGTLVLSHFLVRTILLIVGTATYQIVGSPTIFLWNIQLNPAWLLISMALVHGLLSLSSLNFHVPKKSNQSKPMIHSLFRAHSICFALRAVACMLIYVLLQEHPVIRTLALSIIVFTALVGADLITIFLTDNDDRYNTTASMPYWFGCSLRRQRIHKFFYAYAQFLATYVCLLGGYAGAFFTLPAIQGAALLMTLVRKNIISNYTYHSIYTVLLFFPIPFIFLVFEPSALAFGLAFTLVLFIFRTLGVNKYVLWMPVLFVVNYMLVPELHRTLYINGLAFLLLTLILINMLYNNFFSNKRIDKNNRIISTKKISHDAYEIIIRTKLPFNLLPGQHVMIRFNDQLEKRYTPIWTKHLKESDQTLLCLRVKKYALSKQTSEPIKSIPSTSAHLTNYPVNTIIDLHGPLGDKYYCQNTRSLIDRMKNHAVDPKEKNIYLLSAGSGITPLFQMAKYICANNMNVTLITCDKSPDHLMMAEEITELKDQFPALLKWVSIFSASETPFDKADIVINERLKPEILHKLLDTHDEAKNRNKQNVLIMCGPNDWQNMIKNTLENQHKDQLELMAW